jgi:hypothetical protein
MDTACVSESLKMPATAFAKFNEVLVGVPGKVSGGGKAREVWRVRLSQWRRGREASEPCSLVTERCQSDLPVEMTTFGTGLSDRPRNMSSAYWHTRTCRRYGLTDPNISEVISIVDAIRCGYSS